MWEACSLPLQKDALFREIKNCMSFLEIHADSFLHKSKRINKQIIAV